MKRVTCSDVRPQMDSYLMGNLSVNVASKFEGHISACTECRKLRGDRQPLPPRQHLSAPATTKAAPPVPSRPAVKASPEPKADAQAKAKPAPRTFVQPAPTHAELRGGIGSATPPTTPEDATAAARDLLMGAKPSSSVPALKASNPKTAGSAAKPTQTPASRLGVKPSQPAAATRPAGNAPSSGLDQPPAGTGYSAGPVRRRAARGPEGQT